MAQVQMADLEADMQEDLDALRAQVRDCVGWIPNGGPRPVRARLFGRDGTAGLIRRPSGVEWGRR